LLLICHSGCEYIETLCVWRRGLGYCQRRAIQGREQEGRPRGWVAIHCLAV